MEKRIIRCAVIGLGVMGKKYALILENNEIPSMTLSAVCCRSDQTAAWAKEHLNTDIFRGEDEMYSHGDLFDAVLIVTPHRQHPAMTIRALQEGKHVMCEKPAGILMEDAEKMSSLAEEKNLVLGLMCHQRTFESHRKIKQLLEENTIGEVTRVCMENTTFFRTRKYHASGTWRSSWKGEGGGALINQGYHLIDLWQYLFGVPQSLYACIPFGKGNDFQVDDEATLCMEYPGKMTGTFILSTIEGCGRNMLEIIGTKGRILLDDALHVTLFDQDVREYARNADVSDRAGLQETTVSYPIQGQSQAYQIMLRNFCDAIVHGEPLIAPSREGVGALSIINAAYLSAWTEKKVHLPINMDLYRSYLKKHEEQE